MSIINIVAIVGNNFLYGFDSWYLILIIPASCSA